MSGPSPDEVRHVRYVGAARALCGYDVTGKPGAGFVQRQEQRMDDCAECQRILREPPGEPDGFDDG